MAALLALLPAAGHDQMWLLYAAHLIHCGSPIYGPEVFETNPPMILWLSYLPASAASLLHLSETAVGKSFVVALSTLVAAVCLRLVRRTRESASQPALNPAARCWLAFVFVTVFAVVPARDFGQRDHLLAMLCLPYIFAAALSVASAGGKLPVRAGACIGMTALAGIAMKPHQLLIPIAVESTVLYLRSQNRVPRPALSLIRPELLAMAASGLAYLLAVRILAPNYFTQLVPLVIDTYWAFGQWPLPHLFVEAIQLHILAAVAFGLFCYVGPRQSSPLICLLLAAGAASLIAYYLQGTGWYYQQLPSLTFFSLALAFLLIEFAGRRHLAMPAWAPRAALALSALALALTTHFMNYPFTAARSFPIDTPDPSFFTNLAPGTAVATLTTTVDYVMPPIFKYNLTLAQRYPHLWMLPAILRSEDPQGGRLKRHLLPARIAELDAFQHAAMREDLQRWRPQLILVERCQDPAVHCQVLEDRHDNLLAWFLRDPGFGKIFSHYHYLRSSGRFDAYAPN
ncbi:MAG: hypothetical protein ABR910_17100 [Acidobacteriaceae bacterium]|jgi:hypothetical protein